MHNKIVGKYIIKNTFHFGRGLYLVFFFMIFAMECNGDRIPCLLESLTICKKQFQISNMNFPPCKQSTRPVDSWSRTNVICLLLFVSRISYSNWPVSLTPLPRCVPVLLYHSRDQSVTLRGSV